MSQSRLRSLRERHASLESAILDEDSRPRPNDERLRELKREKLRIKEQIARLEGDLVGA